MRDAATPQDDGPDAQPLAALTPQQRAANIRAAAEVLIRVQQWRRSLNWQDNDANQRRYQLTAGAVAVLDALPDPKTHDGIGTLVDTVRPILVEWRPSRPGPEQTIYAAVEQLHRAAVR